MGWRRIAAAVTRPIDLGGPLGVTRSGVAYVVDQLCAKGLIARHTGEVPGDRRAVVLTMTDPGRAEAAEVCASIAATRWQLGSVFAAVRDRKDRQQDPQASRRHDRRPGQRHHRPGARAGLGSRPGAVFFVYFAESVAMSQGQKLLVDALEAHGGSDDEAPSWVNHDLDASILAITFDGLRPRHDSRAGDRSVGAVQADGG